GGELLLQRRLLRGIEALGPGLRPEDATIQHAQHGGAVIGGENRPMSLFQFGGGLHGYCLLFAPRLGAGVNQAPQFPSAAEGAGGMVAEVKVKELLGVVAPAIGEALLDVAEQMLL